MNRTLHNVFNSLFNLLFLQHSKLQKKKLYIHQLLIHNFNTHSIPTFDIFQFYQNVKVEPNSCSVIIQNVTHHSATLSPGRVGTLKALLPMINHHILILKMVTTSIKLFFTRFIRTSLNQNLLFAVLLFGRLILELITYNPLKSSIDFSLLYHTLKKLNKNLIKINSNTPMLLAMK